jgi:predicted PurR-regulated permease PerM
VVEQVEKTRVISTAQMLRDGFDKAVAYLQENSFELINIGRRVVTAISSGIFTLFMTLMLAGYMMLSQERIFAFFRELWSPSSRPSFDRFVERLDRGLAGVVRGQLLICLVNGVLSAIGFSLFGLKYWPILALVAAVMSLIPIFGSILSSVPAVAIGLTQSPATAVEVLAWIVGIHQLEANFLNPKIIGDTAKIHPVLVVFSLIVGEHFFQLAGALFAVPCMSVAQTIFLHFRESTMGIPAVHPSVPPPGPPRRGMDAPSP